MAWPSNITSFNEGNVPVAICPGYDGLYGNKLYL